MGKLSREQKVEHRHGKKKESASSSKTCLEQSRASPHAQKALLKPTFGCVDKSQPACTPV